MALNAGEKQLVAQAFLRCYETDYYWCGRTLRFINDVAGQSLLANVQTEVDTWQPFIAEGMDANSRQWWKDQLARVYNNTTTT